jgi:hypothetical protein
LSEEECAAMKAFGESEALRLLVTHLHSREDEARGGRCGPLGEGLGRLRYALP